VSNETEARGMENIGEVLAENERLRAGLAATKEALAHCIRSNADALAEAVQLKAEAELRRLRTLLAAAKPGNTVLDSWPFDLRSAAELVARVAWPAENPRLQAEWAGRLASEPEILEKTARLARLRLDSAIAALTENVQEVFTDGNPERHLHLELRKDQQ
jgi:hypothetical protein